MLVDLGSLEDQLSRRTQAWIFQDSRSSEGQTESYSLALGDMCHHIASSLEFDSPWKQG
jgi:hypothetical protein